MTERDRDHVEPESWVFEEENSLGTVSTIDVAHFSREQNPLTAFATESKPLTARSVEGPVIIHDIRPPRRHHSARRKRHRNPFHYSALVVSYGLRRAQRFQREIPSRTRQLRRQRIDPIAARAREQWASQARGRLRQGAAVAGLLLVLAGSLAALNSLRPWLAGAATPDAHVAAPVPNAPVLAPVATAETPAEPTAEERPVPSTGEAPKPIERERLASTRPAPVTTARAESPAPTRGVASGPLPQSRPAPAVVPPESAPVVDLPLPASVALNRTPPDIPRPAAVVAAPVITPEPAIVPPVTSVAPAVVAAAPSVAAVVQPRIAIQSVLSRYAAAFSALDASGAKAVWPGVNERGLARAFSNLHQQEVDLGDCSIWVSGPSAVAACEGTNRYTPKVGSRSVRSEARQWTFHLQQTGSEWWIESVDSR